jgi:hypothetical protein
MVAGYVGLSLQAMARNTFARIDVQCGHEPVHPRKGRGITENQAGGRERATAADLKVGTS